MTVNTTTARVSYAGNGTTKTFTVPFYFLETSHLLVTKRSTTGVETVYTLTTNYTVSGAGVSSGGTITLTSGTAAPASGETITISRSVPLTQTTDYIANDDFPAESHERALDKLCMANQQQQLDIDRAVKFPVSDSPSINMILPTSIQRANKLVRFDASGNIDVTTEDYVANLQTVANNTANINTVAGSITNVNAVGNNIANVNAVAANETNINAVKNNATNINTVAASIANVNTVGGAIANVNTVAGNTTNINTVAGISANVTTVAGNNANVTTVATNISSVNTVATNISNINTAVANLPSLAGKVSITGDTMTGTLTTPRVNFGDVNFSQYLNGSNPQHNWDNNDYTYYDRANNQIIDVIGGTIVRYQNADGSSYNRVNGIDGLMHALHVYRLNGTVAGSSAATTDSSILGAAITLQPGTYEFEGLFILQKTAGATSHITRFKMGGTALADNIAYTVNSRLNASLTAVAAGTTYAAQNAINTLLDLHAASTTAAYYLVVEIKGSVSISTAGTFAPFYNLSAAPGGGFTTLSGSYMKIGEVGARNTNINIGSWA